MTTGMNKPKGIPKHIDLALRRRTRAAKMFTNNDYIVSQWIENNGLADVIAPENFHGGVEAVVNPDASEQAIRDAAHARLRD